MNLECKADQHLRLVYLTYAEDGLDATADSSRSGTVWLWYYWNVTCNQLGLAVKNKHTATKATYTRTTLVEDSSSGKYNVMHASYVYIFCTIVIQFTYFLSRHQAQSRFLMIKFHVYLLL